MKSLINNFSFFLLFNLLLTTLYAQDVSKCKSFVSILEEGIQLKSIDEIKPWLSEDFSILGQKGEIAEQVMQMLFTQKLNDNILSIQEVKQLKEEKKLTLIYSFVYENLGTQKTSISFNEENKVISLSLIEAKVKVLHKEDKLKVHNLSAMSYQIIPFELKSKLLIVDVILNGQPRKFILDSGSSRTILNTEFQATEESKSISNAKGKGVHNIEVKNQQDILIIPSIQFGQLKAENEKVLVTDLSTFSKETNTEIYGIIGTDFIHHFDISFDYEKKEITLIQPKAFIEYQKTVDRHSEYTKFPIKEMKGHLPIIEVQIDHRFFDMAIDCGAGANLFSIHHFELLKSNLKRVKTTGLIGISGSKEEVKKGKIKKMYIGDFEFKSINTVFSNIDHLNKNTIIDGILGFEIMSKQKFIISYQRKEILIQNRYL